jgi:hypothetical protein
MTVYVDDAGIPADVTDQATGRTYKSQWCHLFSDRIDQAELHAFAASIGLRREWFQPGHDLLDRSRHDPVGDHYDITAGKRTQAVKAGAVSVDIREAVRLWDVKRQKLRDIELIVANTGCDTDDSHDMVE